LYTQLPRTRKEVQVLAFQFFSISLSDFPVYTPTVVANMAFPFSRIKKLRLLLPRAVVVFVLVAIGFAQNVRAEPRKERSARPVIYNYISPEADPIDQMIRDHYGPKYEIVEIRREPTYFSARLTRTRFPNPVFDAANMEVSGSVRVCVIITADGRLVDPFIIGSAKPLLVGPVLEVLKEFRARPARLHGIPVAAVDAFKFRFGDLPRRRIDTGN
jgi:hypothetical protein